MPEAVIIKLTLLGVAAFCVLIGLPFYLGKVGPNPWAGFRTPRTLADPKVWYRANRIMGRNFMLSGLVISAGVATMLVAGRGLPVKTQTAVLVGLAVGSLFLSVIHCFVALRRL